jgi:hypothetical protein
VWGVDRTTYVAFSGQGIGVFRTGSGYSFTMAQNGHSAGEDVISGGLLVRRRNQNRHRFTPRTCPETLCHELVFSPNNQGLRLRHLPSRFTGVTDCAKLNLVVSRTVWKLPRRGMQVKAKSKIQRPVRRTMAQTRTRPSKLKRCTGDNVSNFTLRLK